MKNTSTKIKIFSLAALWLFTLASVAGAYYAIKIPTNYSMEQFLPKKHQLLKADRESKKVFQISEASPHILLLSFSKKAGQQWNQPENLKKLNKLSSDLKTLKGVKSVVSLGNIPSAFEKKGELVVGPLNDLEAAGFETKNIALNPLYTPNLMSKDGLHTAVFVMPESLSQDQHRALLGKIRAQAVKAAPQARVQVGGPAAIRTQLIDLLSHEIVIFIALALLCSIIVLKVMFHGYSVLWQALFVLIIGNLLALGVMGALGISFNILASTVPIIITVSSLGIFTHLLVRMSEFAEFCWAKRMEHLKELVREISVVITLTGLSTSVGFACLIPSDVQLISDYGLAVALGVLVSSLSTLVLVPSLYVWVKWPMPRNFLHEPKRFARFVVRNARVIVPAMMVFTLVFGAVGMNLSWTAKLFDDLPAGHPAGLSTDLIGKKLGGVATVDFMIGGDRLKDPWKNPANLQRLHDVSGELRGRKDVGSVLSLADFVSTNGKLPGKREGIAEMQFLYGMSGDSPLKQFLSSNEKWTRLAVRLPDMPADRNNAAIAAIEQKLQAKFPGMKVRTSGMAAIVPPMNKELSLRLMWGFFEALFGIVLVLGIYFRSLRWALIGVVPNLVPPAMLLGFLALFNVPIKPGIAIIFSISLGIAFDNTIYILGRLKHLLKEKARVKTLPVYTLMKKETMPCLVSAMCLFAGFSIFLFSVFPVNKLFGLFVLVSILAGLLGDLVWLPAILRRYPGLLLGKMPSVRIKEFPFRLQETAVKLSPYLILLALGAIAMHNTFAHGASKTSVEDLIKKLESQGAPPNERVQLKMVIQEADGSKKERVLTITRKTEAETRVLVRLMQPSDLKGLSLLTVAAKGGKEEQWLYLPSDKKSRRILGSNKKGKFLDSEISFEDLSISTYKQFNNRVAKEDDKTIEIESKAKADSESTYGKVVTWVSKPELRLEKVEYYDKGGKLLKRTEFKGYTKVGGKFWRAKQMLVQNLQDKRKTSLTLQKVNLGKIEAEDVSLSALEE